MQIQHHARTLRRSAFTLVEVLVAAGLCVFIMTLLSYAFVAGIDTLSYSKSLCDLSEQLATAQSQLKNDLSEVHLENDLGEPLKVSQLRYDALWNDALRFDPTIAKYIQPPKAGYFRFTQEGVSLPDHMSGTTAINDIDGIGSTLAYNHSLQFTVRLPADRRDRVFTTRLPQNVPMALIPTANAITQFSRTDIDTTPGTFSSNWAEVGYFLKPTSPVSTVTNDPNLTPQKLYSLHRRVRLLLPKGAPNTLEWYPFNHTNVNPGPPMMPDVIGAPGMSVRAGTVVGSRLINTPVEVTDPRNRMGGVLGTRTDEGVPPTPVPNSIALPYMTPQWVDNLAPLGTGDDMLLSNVLSFEIKAMWEGGLHVVNSFVRGTSSPDSVSLPQFIRGASFPHFVPLTVRQPGSLTEPRPAAAGGPMALTTANVSLPTTAGLPNPQPQQNRPDGNYDDLPLAPSLPKNFAPSSGMTTYRFPDGSGNPNFARWDAGPGIFSIDVVDPPPPNQLRRKPRVFDTWTQAFGEEWKYAVYRQNTATTDFNANDRYIPLPIRVRAIQIKLRLYDHKNKQTRQVTIVQDL